MILFFVTSAFTVNFPGFAHKGDLAGCDLSITASNASASDVIKVLDLSWKIKGGWWATVIPDPPAIVPGGKIHHLFHVIFNCDVNRRYRFKLQRNSEAKTGFIYYPSETGWTTETDVNFGDMNGYL